MSSWSFTVRSSNSCTALTQVCCESLYSDEKKNSVSSPSARIVSDEWQSIGKNKERKDKERICFSLCLQLDQSIIPRRGSLHLHRRNLFRQCTHCLGTGHLKEGSALLSSPVHNLNSSITYKPLRQIYKKEQCTCWNKKAFIYLFRCYIPKEATCSLSFLVPNEETFGMKSPSFQNPHSLKVHVCFGHAQNNMSRWFWAIRHLGNPEVLKISRNPSEAGFRSPALTTLTWAGLGQCSAAEMGWTHWRLGGERKTVCQGISTQLF